MPAGTGPRRRRAGLKSHQSSFSWGRHRALVAALLVVGFGLSGVSGVVAYFLPAISAAFSITGHPTSGPAAGKHPISTPSAAPVTNSSQPFNVLLLGSDNDTKFQANHVLAQTIILVRVNPQAHTVVMFSIPRDLWVPIAGGGTAKIDSAYSDGGAADAVATVENNFGVAINYWVWIGLGGLVQLVNDLHGVNVVAQMPILDDEYPSDLTGANPYLQARIAILPGPQRLGGVAALEYVRSRHGDVLSDIARSQKQQQLLLDIKASAADASLADVPTIAGSLGSSVKTDMSITQVTSLLPLAKAYSDGQVTQVVMVGSPYFSGTTIGGQDVLLPNWSAIHGLVAQYFPG
ncbi:MAG TPA: LCP family protein [Candidatus Dormibacteraeota bacterium]|nr:LCP family protein [Candidatus Dormibacteraeota bacterium]